MPTKFTHSPWGEVQHQREVAKGITQVMTASHGGYFVERSLWNEMPVYAQETPYSHGGWFEEDTDVALVVICFPDLFAHRSEVVESAKEAVQKSYPEIASKLQRDRFWDSGVRKVEKTVQ
jgi:hypothetical protein